MRRITVRTMILALAVVLLAAPAWATVYITATHEGGGVVRIDCNSVGEPNLVRAFALDITVTEGNIVDCCDYVVGDDNYGYGIFPGTFGVLTVNPGTGMVETWDVNTYTPVSAGLDTNWVTIELGSLYDTNAPGDYGTLCRVVVSSNPAYLSVTENLLSGGVVMEDANGPVGGVDVSGATDVSIGVNGHCCLMWNDPACDDWEQLGAPACWCPPPSGSGYQCDGDCDGVDSGMPFKFRVYTGDLYCIIAEWKKKMGDPTLNPCADIDHKDSGMPFKFRVYTTDLNIIIANWKRKAADLPGDCPRPE